jgi:hypothetical protein
MGHDVCGVNGKHGVWLVRGVGGGIVNRIRAITLTKRARCTLYTATFTLVAALLRVRACVPYPVYMPLFVERLFSTQLVAVMHQRRRQQPAVTIQHWAPT